MTELKTHVAGFRVGAFADRLGVLTDHEVDLVREPENVYDRNAIKVMYFDHKLGYVPKAHAEVLSPLIDKGAIKIYGQINVQTLPHDILLNVRITNR